MRRNPPLELVNFMKIQHILLLSLIASANVLAETEAERSLRLNNDRKEMENNAMKKSQTSAVNSANCEEAKKKAKNELNKFGSNNENLDGDTGTQSMKKCVDLTQGAMRYLRGKNQRVDDNSWKTIIESSDDYISATKVCTGEEKDNETKIKEAISKVKAALIKCDAAAFIIAESNRDWENPDHVIQKTVKGAGAPPIECQGKGVATVDYDGCVKFVQNGDLMEVAQQAVQKGQELFYADKTMSKQAEVAKSDNTATAALEALKEGVKSQKEMMEQRAALDTGKLAVLANFYMDMPNKEDVLAKCDKYSPPAALQSVSEFKRICTNTVIKNEFGFLMNEMAKEKMKTKLIKVGIDVGSDAVMASLMAKREGDLNKTIANVNAFKPIDPLAPQQTNLQTTYCQQNPGDPKCLTGGLERTFDMMNDNVITFGEGGTGASYTATNPFADTTNTTTNAVSPSKNSITGVGSTIAAAQQSSGLADHVAAGEITKGGASPAGGGGGGGGGSAGGGGGTPSGGGGAQSGASAAISGRAPAYNGGSGFSLVGNGSGLRNAKAKGEKDENPFGKLFGKNNANGAVNFRDIASTKMGDQKDNIFDMISKRYSSVNSEKRLIEYEQAK